MIKQVNLFGYTIRSTSLEEVTSYLLNLRHEQGFRRVVTLNSEMVVRAERHKLLKSWLRKADVVVADGQGGVMASCLLSSNKFNLNLSGILDFKTPNVLIFSTTMTKTNHCFHLILFYLLYVNFQKH